VSDKRVQLWCAYSVFAFIGLFLMGWVSLAAFRPEDAVRVQTFNDLGWLPFLGIVCTGMFQMVALAVITLRDACPDPVFPRWFAFFQLWCAAGVGLSTSSRRVRWRGMVCSRSGWPSRPIFCAWSEPR
jgi:hypothetical protein